MTNRRSFLTALGAGYAMASKTWAQSQRAARAAGARSTELFFTAETAYGKVQGMVNTGIKEFKGIPYGAPTGGKNRYMPPKKPAAWTGVRECLAYGPISPQTGSSLAQRLRPVDRVGPAYGHRHGRGCSDAQCLDARAQRRRQARRAGFLPRRRIRHRFRQRPAIRRRTTRAAGECCGGHGQSSAGESRLSASCGSGRASRVRACGRGGNDGSGRVARMGP